MPPPSEGAYRLAIGCGVTPLCVGTVALVGYLLTRAEAFAMTGFLTMPAGVLLFVIGAVALVYYVSTVWRRGERLGPRTRRTAVAACLLLANFPVAALYAMVGHYDMTTQTLSIANAAGETVDSFVVTADGVDHELGPIPAGGTASFSFRPRDDDDGGDVHFGLRMGPATVIKSEPWPGAIHGPFGRTHAATIGPGGSVTTR
jgi:hypothetical protein